VPEEEEESDGGADMAGMVDSEDIDFLRRAVTQKSYSMLKRLRYKQVSHLKVPLTPQCDNPVQRHQQVLVPFFVPILSFLVLTAPTVVGSSLINLESLQVIILLTKSF
jgi:hypothetical protein